MKLLTKYCGIIFIIVGLACPAFAQGLYANGYIGSQAGGGGSGGGGSSSTPFNAGSIQTFTSEVAYAGTGSQLSFSGYTALHPPVSVDTTNGGNVTVNWTHGGIGNSKTVAANGTFAANTDLSSGSITALTGALTLTFLAGHAPDNGTNITITYTKGILCNFAGTDRCYFTCNPGTASATWSLFNPSNLPAGGGISFALATAGNDCYGNVTFDTNFYGGQQSANPQNQVSIAGTQQPYAPWSGCFYNGNAGGSSVATASTNGTRVSMIQCGNNGLSYLSNLQVAVGDTWGDYYFHNHEFLGSLTCGSVAGCGSGTLGTCNAGSHLGAVQLITDSTAITSEGQACVGNGSNAALAVCTGAGGWNCFGLSPTLTGSVSVTATTAVGCTDGTVSVTGATTSMAVLVSPASNPNGTSGAVTWAGYVSASNTVDVRVCNHVTETSPPATTYNIRVIP